MSKFEPYQGHRKFRTVFDIKKPYLVKKERWKGQAVVKVKQGRQESKSSSVVFVEPLRLQSSQTKLPKVVEIQKVQSKPIKPKVEEEEFDFFPEDVEMLLPERLQIDDHLSHKLLGMHTPFPDLTDKDINFEPSAEIVLPRKKVELFPVPDIPFSTKPTPAPLPTTKPTPVKPTPVKPTPVKPTPVKPAPTVLEKVSPEVKPVAVIKQKEILPTTGERKSPTLETSKPEGRLQQLFGF